MLRAQPGTPRRRNSTGASTAQVGARSSSTRTGPARSASRPQESPQSLQTLLTGTPVTQYREGTELIDVVARAAPRSASTSTACRT